MIDAKWWNRYFALPDDRTNGNVFITERASQQGLEEYQLLRYAEITGDAGRWEYTDRQQPECNDDCNCVVFVVVILFVCVIIYLSS